MDFGNQLFSNQSINIPEGTQVVFVSDLFVEDYVGGAELTSEALIESSPFQVFKLKSHQVSLEILEQGHGLHWVFGNFANMKLDLIPTIVANMSYSILEYDFKFCRYRSPQKHQFAEGEECNCDNEMQGKLVSAFYHGARSIWWMSERQQEEYWKKFPFLKENNQVVLSSVFGDAFWIKLKELREKYSETERSGWIVLGSPSWVKGAEAAENRAKELGVDYEVVWGLPYSELLEKLAQAEGFIYHPQGWDTCPRMVIEAHLLGCKLDLNDNVLHKDEIWFKDCDMLDTESYLFAARERFWTQTKNDWNWRPTISGYTTTLDCIKNKYPWKESIESMLDFCDEVVVVDGGSTDGTWEFLEGWSKSETRLKAYKNERDWDHPRFAVFDGAQKAYARLQCTSDFCWQQDADEIVVQADGQKIHNLIKHFPPQVDLVSLPVVEYWGGPEKVRMDINPWKWRISRNKPHITHGIPKELLKRDDDGNEYAAMGTDGCDYVHADTGDLIPHASFYHYDAHNLRVAALSGDKEAYEQYADWFKRNVEALPGVRHYSWFNISRKIRTYKNYWSRHWQSLYDIEQEDTAENNMFFDKPWSKVSDAEIDALAERLANETGGHVFHSKVDWSRPTPHIEF
jgi:glycosyltransferase involved in cell wall biosynthesis/adenylate kinase family enzyme